MSVLAEHGCIAGHLDNVAIALYIGEVESLGECRLDIGTLHVGAGRPFAKIDLNSLPYCPRGGFITLWDICVPLGGRKGGSWITVVIIAMVHEPSRRLVIMLVGHILQVGVLAGEVPALDVVGRRSVEGSYGAANHDLGMALAQGTAYHLIALFEDGADDVLIAYAEILQMERLGMTSLGALACPLVGGWVGVGPVDEVAELIDVSRHLIHRNASLLSCHPLGIGSRVLAGYTCGKYG